MQSQSQSQSQNPALICLDVNKLITDLHREGRVLSVDILREQTATGTCEKITIYMADYKIDKQ